MNPYVEGAKIDAGRITELEALVEKLDQFKQYVHHRLDAAGIPTHPDGPHSKEGCRVGDRLDIALGAMAESKRLREALQRLAAFRPEGIDAEPHRVRLAISSVNETARNALGDQQARHLCTKCGWSGSYSELRVEGKLRFCPRCPYMTREIPPAEIAANKAT